MTTVVPIPLGITKAFLVKDREAILVDTGCPNDENRILAALDMEGVKPADIRLILHTHGHYDHCGSTAKLKEVIPAPAAIHRDDVHLIEKGTSDPLIPIAFGARLVRLISYRSFLPVKPDLVIEEEMPLDAFGVSGRILFTPGHTAGSISLLLGGGQAIAGDLMVGGYLAGHLFPGRPGYHYFADDLTTLHRSIQKLLASGANTVFVAHGGPLARDAIMARFPT
jgi:glyoxylase-like metal-dependent hydrolase (beta-lactamase superfamily II)